MATENDDDRDSGVSPKKAAVSRADQEKEEAGTSPDGAFLPGLEELILEVGKDPFSAESWRRRLEFVYNEVTEDIATASVRRQWELARAIDRIAIMCILDHQGRYELHDGEVYVGDPGIEFDLYEFGRHYRFGRYEFAEWNDLDRLGAFIRGETGIPLDLDDRVMRAMRDAEARYIQALEFVGS